MSLIINHNLMASNSARNLNTHYASLSNSTRRLSSGLRINSSSDDAAGLAIRELQRADIRALQQGARNANDAISMIQVADGALVIIDEKLIRMTELAEQAATGTYDSTQRLMIDSEFQAMATEINRIADATDFNGIHLLNGNLSGRHDGSGLTSTGALKVHFGSGNDSAEDYYYVEIPPATLEGLGLEQSGAMSSVASRTSTPGVLPLLSDVIVNGDLPVSFGHINNPASVPFAIIPKGTTNLKLNMFGYGLGTSYDAIEIFTTSGVHIAGTTIGYPTWAASGIGSSAALEAAYFTAANGFAPGATYQGTQLNGSGTDVPYNPNAPYNSFSYNGMNINYSGDGTVTTDYGEFLEIDYVSEDLIFMVSGSWMFDVAATWQYEPTRTDITTQDNAQKALDVLHQAIVKKDGIRAHLGALQNRLENTISNLKIQAENLQAAESRISDVDVATEMTAFTKDQILTQSATAMLAQANSLPKMALQVIGG